MQGQQIFQKILVPVDGSIPSINAEELTAFLAKKLGSKVTVIHVVSHELLGLQLQRFAPETPEYVYSGPRPQGAPIVHVHSQPDTARIVDEITNSLRGQGEEIISDAVKLFEEEGISADQKLVEHASPAETIVKEAKKGDYDLIAIGYSGEKEKEPHLGSVAEKVSRHAHTPVLIAKEKNRISKMLVPVDGSESSEKALQYAVALAKKTDAKITLLHVQESRLFGLNPRMTKEIGTRILSHAAGQAEGIKLDQVLESGDPAKVIAQTGDKGDYDIIIMGCKGHSAVGRFLLGDVSDHVIHYANRSVLIVK